MTPTTPVDDLDALLAAHAIGALDGDELEQVERMLATDADARAELARYQRASAELRSSDGPGPEVWSSILTAVEDDDRGAGIVPIGAARQRRRVVRTIGLAAALAVAAGLSAWGLDQSDSSSPPAPTIERTPDPAGIPDGEHVTLTTADGQTVKIVLLPDGRGLVLDGTLPRLVDGTYRLLARTADGVVQLSVIGDRIVHTAFAVPADLTELLLVRTEGDGVVTLASSLAQATGTSGGTPPAPAPTTPGAAGTPGPASSTPPAVPGVPPLLPTITLPTITLPPLFG